ncbi:MAG: ribulose-phosphate 3-epimerase [Bacteroidales bacterium]|nr:ribulose-phosphate 3-epimerase [Bacteroidales bacterium]
MPTVNPLIAPSMLAADFLHLAKDVELVNEHADLFHLDIMDGVFVPNISYGFPVVEAIASAARKPLDVHLMIVQPEKYIERFARLGVSMLSFHLNATDKPAQALLHIREAGMKAGLVINPDMPVESLYPYLHLCDYIILMSVYAGFGGQKFIEDTFDRIRTLKAEIERQSLPVKIEVDGGVSPANAKALLEAGAEILVAGSAVFKAEDPASVMNAMRN